MLLATCSLSKVCWLASSCVTPKSGSWKSLWAPPSRVCLSATCLGPATCLCVGKGEDGGFWRDLGIPDPTCQPRKTHIGEDDLITQVCCFSARWWRQISATRLSTCPHMTCSRPLLRGGGESWLQGFREITLQLLSSPFLSGALHLVLRAW